MPADRAKVDASPRAADLLFEIGCEEIPAKMLARALVELPGLVESRLTAARLTHGGVRALGTPRRLAVIVKQLADRQPDLSEEVVGPPAGAAFAADGSVTKAGQGFAAKNGVAPDALVKREVAGKKGLYVVAIRSVVGQPTRGLLPDLLADLARSIAWPKSQRWGWGDTTFVRPVQWLVALFGGEVVPLSWAGITSGRHSRGHRFLANRPIEIAAADGYVEALRAAHVVVDQDVRRDLVRAELVRLEAETGLRVRPDDGLLAEVIHLGEYPVGVSGTFDPSFLEVPEEIIVTAMRTHQRYFAMEDAAGKLAPRFATVMATIVKDPAVVQRGNESVLASRLSDAKFFFAEDRKKSFEQWNEKLASVVFQAKLGKAASTIGHKLRRIEQIVEGIARVDPQGVSGDVALSAARRCKADLASSVVGEFPELQGVMGKHYARLSGLGDAVADAIEQHWWPKGQGSELPMSVEAALIALADRIDTLVGCFATGLQPSGSADPLGLRRAAIAVLTILLDRSPDGPHPWGDRLVAFCNIEKLIEVAQHAYADVIELSDEAEDQLHEFFATRLRGLLVDEGLAAQDIDAVLKVNSNDPPYGARVRARAVAVLPGVAREVFKRIANILDDARAKGLFPASPRVSTELFESSDGVEARLWSAFESRRAELLKAHANRRYREMFQILVELQPHVAAFFDRGGVMVMDPNPALRENRLSMLNAIVQHFELVADFRQLGGAS